MSKDRDYIKELFDSDGIKASESLSEENILAMLEAEGGKENSSQPAAAEENTHVRRRPALKRVAAVAAAAVVAFFGIRGIYGAVTSPPDTSLSDGELYTFKNEREIGNLIRSIDKNGRNVFDVLDIGTDEMVEYESDAAEDTATGTGSDAQYSGTYLQVAEVDEADIVKTDGKYIYYVNTNQEVIILAVDGGNTQKVSTVGNGEVENYIHDIYLKGDRLITVGSFYENDLDDLSAGIVVYDISDRSSPEVLNTFRQTGDIVSSRMVGDTVYLVTNDYDRGKGRTLPLCGSGDELSSMDPADICCVPDPQTSSYIVLSGIDISSGEQGRSATKAILGASDEIYCNDHHLYSASEEWDDDSSQYCTRIVRATLDGIDVSFDATAKVQGHVLDQFAMDERGGYFRIATTSFRAGMDVNDLYVLDQDLHETGNVTGFARNESIKAVRYIGDKAYVITYEAIDPLFIIDLSDPTDPRIEGEVKIDGFSTLLVPSGEGRLLGIGHATGDNGYGGEFASGLKLVVFDISDPSHPEVLSSKEFENMYSFAQDDHRALTVSPDGSYYAIPYEVWHDEFTGGDTFIEDGEDPEIGYVETMYEEGVLVFKADDTISFVDQHVLDSQQIYRCVCIGDRIYALDGSGNALSFVPSF